MLTPPSHKKILALLSFVQLLLLPAVAADFIPPTSGRTTYNLDYDWRFVRDNPAGAERVDFADQAWTTVSCPHTFNDVDTFDDFSTGGHNGESNQWRGTVWYRKHFKLAEADAGKQVFVEFESVRQVADVYLNGRHLGTNRTGFIPFGYDLTPFLNPVGQENILAVQVDNSRPEGDFLTGPNPLPWNHEHWHPTHGGIYRNVYLHVLDKVHVTLPLYDNLQTTGTYVHTPRVSVYKAEVTVEAEVQNSQETPQNVTVEALIVDQEGQVTRTLPTTRLLAAGEKLNFAQTATVLHPHLWSTRYPYLYTVYSIVRVGDLVKDVAQTPLGIRSFAFTADAGFWLNGEPIKLHGWGQKPTNEWAGLGAALPDWLGEFSFRLMDEGGGNFIRWGHCAGAPAEIRHGDRYGFVTLMPGVCGESDNQGEAWDVRIKAFRDMVVYYRNHPSIFIWEGGNWAISGAHFQEITDILQRFDSGSGRLLGNRRAELNPDAANYVTIEVGTEGWDREFPKLPMVESEYCRDEGARRIWDNYSPPDFGFKHPNAAKNTYRWTSEQYAVLQADHWWNKIGKKEYHSGGANWIFSDSTSGGRNYTDVDRASGEVDAVRLPKEAFYALRAMWRPEPQVHIVGHWSYPADRKTVKDVYVISNCPAVTLSVNGTVLATKATPENGYVFRFPAVIFVPGEIRADGLIDGQTRATQQKTTAGPPVALRLTPITGPAGWRADGSDVVLLDVEVVDRHGRRCPTDQARVDFTLTGPAIWRGGYNSGKEHSTNNLFLDTECGINRVAIRSTLQAGPVTVSASRPGLTPASITLTSQAFPLLAGLTTVLPQAYHDLLGAPEPLPLPLPRSGSSAQSAVQKSALFVNFSYTGNGQAELRHRLDNGHKAYTDHPDIYTRLPSYLIGAEYVRTPQADHAYWARDQLQFRAGREMDIYIAHDDRLQRPGFLSSDYADTGDNLTLNRATLSLFKRRVAANTSVILAGNEDRNSATDSTMYVVFAVPVIPPGPKP